MTTPTGRLAYGQAGIYDALDDRAVIAAVTGYRTGLVGLVQAVAGSGLTIVVTGGWLGVADCGDKTSAVLGSPTDQAVTANPGPATGTREDVIWIDVDPDEGTWSMSVVPVSATAGRPGLAIVSITVPANATLASQMTIRPIEPLLERRLLACHSITDTRTVSSTSWGAASTPSSTPEILFVPGRWYRIRYDASSPMKATGTGNLEGRIGVGWRPAGAPESASVMQRAAVITFTGLSRASQGQCELVVRHSPDSAPLVRIVDGRLWNWNAGTLRINQNISDGPGLVLTVEDLGT